MLKDVEKTKSIIQSYCPVTNLRYPGSHEIKGFCDKKLHEISTINHYLRTKEVNKILEIGGGKGNLSYILCKE